MGLEASGYDGTFCDDRSQGFYRRYHSTLLRLHCCAATGKNQASMTNQLAKSL